MPDSAPESGPVAGWPFLIAPGRRRDYSTLIAPDFLVETLDYGVLNQAVRPSADARPAVIGVRTGVGRELTVVYATHLLTAADLITGPAPAMRSVGEGPSPRDEHNRPMRLVYGFVLADGWISQPATADLDQVLATVLDTYRGFLSHEDGAGVVGSRPFPVRSVVRPRDHTQGTVAPPARPAAPQSQPSDGLSRGRTAAMISSVLVVAVAVVAAVLVVGHRAADPTGDPCPTTTVAATTSPVPPASVTCPASPKNR
jgi:hypothetical protein